MMTSAVVTMLMFCQSSALPNRYNDCVRELTSCAFCLGDSSKEQTSESTAMLCLNYETEYIGAWTNHITNPRYIKKCQIKKAKP